ncbi:hypothetical protein AB6A40_007791 [Gnathostoma spinigerum]|uniref:Uncharacterized protein n=1 Tax=Gnathostoma spinigerum TaxID=75299 RepID=A0ABD6EWY6_9BILA
MSTWCGSLIWQLLHVISYVLYRVLRRLILLESDLFSTVKACLTSNVFALECEICYIVCRKRFHVGDIARGSDFMLFHKRFAPSSTVHNDHWSLYTVTSKFAYFVYLPHSSNTYDIIHCPFFSLEQFTMAEYVARIPLNTFVSASHELRHFRGPVVMLTTMAGSGATLLAKFVQKTDESRRFLVVLSEMDVFSMIAAYQDSYEWSIRKVRYVLLAALRFAVKDQMTNQTILFVLRANCTRLVNHFRSIAPFLSFIYIARRDVEASIALQKAIALKRGDIFQTVVSIWKLSRTFCDWLTTWSWLEWSTTRLIDPQTPLEFFISVTARSAIDFVKYRQYYSAPVIFFEDLAKNPGPAVEQVLDICSNGGITCESFQLEPSEVKALELLATPSAELYLAENERSLMSSILSNLGYPIL